MNKKFSTFLCASLLLASAFTTANAADLTGVNNGADAFMVSKLDKAALSGLYQLRVTSTATGNTTNGVLVYREWQVCCQSFQLQFTEFIVVYYDYGARSR